MHLLMITGDRTLASGKQGAFWNTLEELHKHFDRIDVICPRVPVRRYDMVLFGNVHVHPSPWPLIFQWFWIIVKGIQITRNSSFDLRHSVMTVHEYAPVFNGVGAAILHWVTGVPYLLEVMHVTGLPRANGLWEWFNWLLFRWIVPWTARPAKAVRVINQHEVPDFLVAAGVPRSKLVQIPATYLDLAMFKPADISKRYNLIFVGRLARNKGIDLFLEIVHLTGLKACIVGDGPLRDWVQSRITSYSLPVTLSGFAKDSAEVARYINESRLLLMTSYSEGGPRVVLEALACGVPVVATPVGMVLDVLPPECIEEWDASALADKVRNILNDTDLYARLRESGIAITQEFERKKTITRYAEAIKNLSSHV